MNNPVIRNKIYTKERALKISRALTGIKRSKEHKNRMSEIASKRIGSKNPFHGKKHSSEQKELISKLNSKQLSCVDLETNKTYKFKNANEATKFVLENRKIRNKLNSIYQKIRIASRENKEYFGYVWKDEDSGSRGDNK